MCNSQNITPKEVQNSQVPQSAGFNSKNHSNEGPVARSVSRTRIKEHKMRWSRCQYPAAHWLKKHRLLMCILLFGGFGVYVYIPKNAQIGHLMQTFAKYTGNTSERLFAEPSLPERNIPSEAELVADILRKHPTLPAEYLYKPKIERFFNKTCAKMPYLFDIKMDNQLWQHIHLESNDRDLYLFSAHFDNRKAVLETQGQNPKPIVRLLGMTTQGHKNVTKALCLFWFDDQQKPDFSSPATYDYLWNFEWGFKVENALVGVVISCPMNGTNDTRIPDVVSFVERPCDNPKNALKVQRPPPELMAVPPPNGSIAVCIRGLTYWYDDRSFHLVEWLELLKLLGVAKVYVHELALHPNMKKVLHYYENDGYVDLKPFSLPGNQVTEPELLTLFLRTRASQALFNELVPYNDCIYRNWYRYEYVAVMDTDEIILPALPDVYTWSEMISRVVRNDTITKHSTDAASQRSRFPFSSICGRNVHVANNATDLAKYGLPDDVPPYLYMLTHLSRDPNFKPPGSGVKCLHATSRILTMHNHFTFKCVGQCRSTQMDPSVAHMQHYRADCSLAPVSQCSLNTTSPVFIDTTVWKYKKPLVENCNAVLRDLKMIP